MSAPASRVFTIPPDVPFLTSLAAAVWDGFPLKKEGKPKLDQIHKWTILLPTRRACRELEGIFYSLSGASALFLPRIRPIGDIDEDPPVTESHTGFKLPNPISAIGRNFALIALIDEWSRSNPHIRLAQEISASSRRKQALAMSLGQLIDNFETEEVNLSHIPVLYGLESAAHREAILDFLSLVQIKLPDLLRQSEQIGQREWRSRLLRIEAESLSDFPSIDPIIAAGSTGSIPATRALLKAIAASPNGAVVLPGLDLQIDGKSWVAVDPQHPQFILKQLLAELGITRSSVGILAGTNDGLRSWLMGEVMRPTEVSEDWLETVTTKSGKIREALKGVELVELTNKQEEATAIALMLRHVISQPGRTASLVTPDRTLARRVKSELRRWNMEIDDSAGDPLIYFAGPSVINLLVEAVLCDFSPDSLNALSHHSLCLFGMDSAEARRAARVLDIAVFRGTRPIKGIGNIAQIVDEARAAIAADSHSHPVTRRISEDDWASARLFAQRAENAFAPLSTTGPSSLADQLLLIISVAEEMAGPALWHGEAGEILSQLREQLLQEAWRAARCSVADAAEILRHHLNSTHLRPQGPRHSRLSILGLLEARLLRPDVIILGGLNEGTWPSQSDSGPWLNRPMRKLLGMEQPERDIGQTAHDFVQGFGCSQVQLVWSRRDGGDPVIPSRWILRLQMLMKSAGLAGRTGENSAWRTLAARIDEAPAVTPCAKPEPRPPVDARPKQISVTRVETLIRDPYAFYARNILRLQPLENIVGGWDMAMRGTLIHAALGDFLRHYPDTLPEDLRGELLNFGRRHFTPLLEDREIAGFWWPGFERMAEWIANDEPVRRADVTKTLAEIDAALEFDLNGGIYTLICRADRIDLLLDGTARIVDYKTGAVPTGRQVALGMAPQLTLQAAMLYLGGFEKISSRRVSALEYVKLGGGERAGETKVVNLGEPVMACAFRQFDGFKQLMLSYSKREQPYLPRVATQNEDDELPYDHLSRYREWALSGGE